MKKLTTASILMIIIFTFVNKNINGQNNDYPFEVKISGNGSKSIIFIPGFACSGEVWDDTRIQYEDNYKCYALTMAGFAGAAPKSDITFANWEKGIASYIQENKIEKPVIIGHSMGGVLALALASDYPELVSKIVVVDALPCLAALMNPEFKSNDKNDCSEVLKEMMSITDEEFYQRQKKMLPQMIADTSRLELVTGWTVRSDRKTFAEMYCDFSNTDLRDKLAGIKCPALILLESYFVNLKPAITEQYKNLKTADIQYAAKGLHFIMYDDKEWFDNQLNSFIPDSNR